MSKGAWSLEQGDCRDVVRRWADEGIRFDACVTDPPYDLIRVVKRFGSPTAAPAKSNGATGVYARASAGFMGQQWDGTGVAFDPETWSAVYNALKPGAYLAAFGGTRTFHRMAVAIEDAGFEIRDTLCWLYGTGFPKSLDVSKALDKAAGAERPVIGKTIAPRKALDANPESSKYGFGVGEIDVTAPATAAAAAWVGWGTALKPAWEPIIPARRPLVGTVAANVLAHGTGGINIDACRIPAERMTGWGGGAAGGNTWTGENCGLAKDGPARPVDGRWPANVLHDGSPEVLAAFGVYGDKPGQLTRARTDLAPQNNKIYGALRYGTHKPEPRGDVGTAARFFNTCSWEEDDLRFFYSSKASRADRAGSKHPTVKPLSLMRWLVTLVCQPGGLILEPFAGSGSTVQAAVERGFDCMAVEMGEDYCADIRNRMENIGD